MRFRFAVVLIVVAMLLSIPGCGKDKEKKTGEEGAPAGTIVLDNDAIDEFLDNYTVIFDKVIEKRDVLSKINDENPVESAKGSKALEEIKAELAKKGINFDRFNAIYQKIILGSWYVVQKDRMEDVTPEQINEQIAKIEVRMADKSISNDERSRLSGMVAEMKAAQKNGIQLPPGLTTEEAAVFEARYPEIRAKIATSAGSEQVGAAVPPVQ